MPRMGISRRYVRRGPVLAHANDIEIGTNAGPCTPSPDQLERLSVSYGPSSSCLLSRAPQRESVRERTQRLTKWLRERSHDLRARGFARAKDWWMRPSAGAGVQLSSEARSFILGQCFEHFRLRPVPVLPGHAVPACALFVEFVSSHLDALIQISGRALTSIAR